MHGAMGAIFSGTDVRDYKAVYTASVAEFPKEFELEIVRIKNQKNVSSCVGHSLSSILEYYNNKQNNDPTEMSVGYIYGNRTTSDYYGQGMVMRDALEAVCKYGDVPKEDFFKIASFDNIEVPIVTILFNSCVKDLFEYSYPHRLTQYCRVTSKNAMKASLYAGNPIAIGMNWYEDMEVIDGVLTTDYKECCGGHCMYIYGWDERGWKVANSWGKEWGNNGTMIIPYEMPIEECWLLADDFIEGIVIKKPFSSKLGKKVAKVINKICHWWND